MIRTIFFYALETMKAVWLGFISLALAIPQEALASSPPPLTDMGTLGGNYSYPQAINAAGQVIGYSHTAGNSSYRAFIWDATHGMQDLGTLGGNWSYAYLLNDAGHVAGYSPLSGHNDAHGFFVNLQSSDTTPPVINSLTASATSLWPDNHKMVAITLTANATDNVGVTSLKIISATSNEPDNGLGDGDTANDIAITGDLQVNLRAERSGKGEGRVYTLTVEASDAAGNTSTRTVTVSVPKSQGASASSAAPASKAVPAIPAMPAIPAVPGSKAAPATPVVPAIPAIPANKRN